MKEEGKGDDGVPVFRATRWQPFEISIVSVPADAGIGVGRSEEIEVEEETKETVEVAETVAETPVAPVAETEVKELDTTNSAPIVEDEKKPLIDDEKGYGKEDDEDEDEEEKSKAIITIKEEKKMETIVNPAPILNEKEARKWSFVNAINSIINKDNSFEKEVSQDLAKRHGLAPQGILVPMEGVYSRTEQNVTTAGQGGNLVATELLSGSFIDKLMNSMLMKDLGAKVLTGLQGNIAIPRKTANTTAYWVAESGDVTGSIATFDQVAMSPKTVGAYVDASRKLLLQSSISADQLIKDDLASTLAIAIDLAALNGLGSSNQPTGIMRTSGIGSLNWTTASTPTFAKFVDLESEVSTDNALMGNLAYVTSAAFAGTCKQTVKVSGYPQYIMENGEINGYRVGVTNQMPASAALFGNFNDLIIGMWGMLDLNVDTATLSKSGSVRIVGLQDVDVAVRHPESFAKCVNVGS
jgi:HK97 family phage major capsid protein